MQTRQFEVESIAASFHDEVDPRILGARASTERVREERPRLHRLRRREGHGQELTYNLCHHERRRTWARQHDELRSEA
jgi:hypothetical protein